jgi:tagatose 6-phosphate kinase
VILTVTCNPAIDVTYTLDRLTPGEVHRIGTVHERPGGKGVNVARVLTQLQQPTIAIGPGDREFGVLLGESGVACDFPVLLPRVRRTVVTVGDGQTTSLWEPGSVATPDAVVALERLVQGHLAAATVLVVSGSVASGLPADLPTRFAALARQAGVPVVLDLDDAPLAAAARAGGAVLMPNREELGRLLDTAVVDDVPAAALALSARTGAPVVVTLGAAGLVAVADGLCWRAVPPEAVPGNPTGAGDATAAGVALGLARGLSWPEILPHAVALGAAAVLAPLAGEVDRAAYRRWVEVVTVEPVASLAQER